jgi:hypothetical protein
MKVVAVVLSALAISGASYQAADAKDCIKGALLGGAAGHYAGHHGLLGAAAGCAIGRHEANKRSRMTTETDGRGGELHRDQRDGR